MDKCRIRDLIEDKPPPIIFEIGAADGIDTQDFIALFDDIDFKMYCFEPDKQNLSIFKERINDPRVKLFEGAVGNISGDITFYSSTSPYTSSLRPPGKPMFEVKEWKKFFESEKNWESTIVKSITLDDFVSQNNIPYISFIWADVQGCEDLMIMGGKESFKNKVKYLYTEYSNTPYYVGEPNLKEILALLPDYEIINDFKSDILLKNRNL